MKAQLILENGKRFSGELFGDIKNIGGQIVFSTEMIGYQDILTDSKYQDKIVVMTFPLIGNYGINHEDIGADKITPIAMVVREKCDFPSNFRMEMTIDDFFKVRGVVGISGIDTRALTKQLRTKETMRAVIMQDEPDDKEVKAFFQMKEEK